MRLLSWFEDFYLKLPPLSVENREYIVKILPYLSIVFGILIVISSVLEILGTPVLSAFTLNKTLPAIQILLIVNVLGIAQGIMMFSSVPSLNKRLLRGWKLLFWSQVLWIISSLLTFSPSLMISLVLFYPFFQVKKYYQ
jgi:hypothetical protein